MEERIAKDIAILWKDLSRIDGWFKWRRKNGSTKLKCELKKKKFKAKGFKTVIEEFKQRISAKTLKLKRFKLRIKQYQQNRTFEELDGKMRQEQVISGVEE